MLKFIDYIIKILKVAKRRITQLAFGCISNHEVYASNSPTLVILKKKRKERANLNHYRLKFIH